MTKLPDGWVIELFFGLLGFAVDICHTTAPQPRDRSLKDAPEPAVTQSGRPGEFLEPENA